MGSGKGGEGILSTSWQSTTEQWQSMLEPRQVKIPLQNTPTHTLYSHEHIEILVVKNELLFFRQRDGPYLPTLRLLHKCESVVFCSGTLICHGSLTLCHCSIVLRHDAKRIPSPPSSISSPDPTLLPQLQVDKGAIKFILSGANIMCPGLTSPGARMDTPVPENTSVVSSSTSTQFVCCTINIDARYCQLVI